MAINWNYYHEQVLKNPDARPEAKAESAKALGKVNIENTTGESTLPSLPAEGKTGMDFKLPELSTADPNSLLQGAIKSMSNIAKKAATEQGMQGMFGFFEERGVTPEDLPGSTVGNMINVMNQAMVDPVVERAQTISDMVATITETNRENQRIAEKQLDFMINNNMWNSLLSSNPTQANELWELSGMPGTPKNMASPSSSGYDVSPSDLMKFYIPGFSPEMGYKLWTQEAAPPEFLLELEEIKRKDGSLEENASISPMQAQIEWNNMRKELNKDGFVSYSHLAKNDQASIKTINDSIKNEYEQAQAELKDWDERDARGSTKPEPAQRALEAYRRHVKKYPEYQDYIELPY
jgi:hypothetical protein